MKEFKRSESWTKKKGEKMSRQIQIRRGTSVEHENFTGVIGEVTMDTTNKTLRVHDGETVGGTVLAKKSEIPSDIMTADYVIETWRSTDGSSWYRKYKSGWVEQGGKGTGGANKTGNVIQLPVTMEDTNYNLIASIHGSISNAAPKTVIIVSKTNSSFNASTMYAGTGGAIDYVSLIFEWFCFGK